VHKKSIEALLAPRYWVISTGDWAAQNGRTPAVPAMASISSEPAKTTSRVKFLSMGSNPYQPLTLLFASMCPLLFRPLGGRMCPDANGAASNLCRSAPEKYGSVRSAPYTHGGVFVVIP
jgi:hypothetical protein